MKLKIRISIFFIGIGVIGLAQSYAYAAHSTVSDFADASSSTNIRIVGTRGNCLYTVQGYDALVAAKESPELLGLKSGDLSLSTTQFGENDGLSWVGNDFVIPGSILPLQEGMSQLLPQSANLDSHETVSISYKGGILTLTDRDLDLSLLKILVLHVTPDLSQVTSADYSSQQTGWRALLGGSGKQSFNCEF